MFLFYLLPNSPSPGGQLRRIAIVLADTNKLRNTVHHYLQLVIDYDYAISFYYYDYIINYYIHTIPINIILYFFNFVFCSEKKILKF